MTERRSKPNPSQADSSKAGDMQYVDSPLSGWRLTTRPRAWRPLTDVYETDDDIVVRVEIAGMREEDFFIELNGRLLSIRGTRQDQTERRAYHQMEIRFGEFNLELELPHTIETEHVQAIYSDGFLRVVLPKAQPRHIPIVE